MCLRSKTLSYLAVAAFTATFSVAVLAQGDPLGAMCNKAARMAFVTGDVASAERACEAAIREGEKDTPPGERLAYPLMKLGGLYMMLGMKEPERNNQALALFERARVIRETIHGPNDPSVGKLLESMAVILASQGRETEGGALYGRVVKIYEDSYGMSSLEVARALRGYATLLQKMKRDEEASQLIRRADAIFGTGNQ